MLVLFATLFTASVEAQTAPADPVPAHDTLTVVSKILGEQRPINVYTPRAYKASATTRLPVLYMPDGAIDEDFPHVVNTVDSLIALGVIRPVIVVGIPNTERRRDLTGTLGTHDDDAVRAFMAGLDGLILHRLTVADSGEVGSIIRYLLDGVAPAH